MKQEIEYIMRKYIEKWKIEFELEQEILKYLQNRYGVVEYCADSGMVFENNNIKYELNIQLEEVK